MTPKKLYSSICLICILTSFFISGSFRICWGDDNSLFGRIHKDCSKEELAKIVDHDMKMMTEIFFHPPGYQKLAAYYFGVIKWIEENGDKTYLPFLEGILNQYKDLNMLKKTRGYFNNYSKGSLYELALSAWYKIKTRDMEDEEIVEMIIESLKASSALPNITEPAWKKYESEIVERRDRIYNILKTEKINPLYDFMCTLSEWNLIDIFCVKGLEPTKEEMEQLLAMNDTLKVDNIIIYLIKIQDKHFKKKILKIILEKYRNSSVPDDFFRYDNFIYGWLSKKEEDKDTLLAIQNVLLEKLKSIPKPWGSINNMDLNKIGFILIKIYQIDDKCLTQETINYLIRYKENINKNIEKITDPPVKSRLKDFVKRLDRVLKKEL